MMNKDELTQIGKDAEELYKNVMRMYWAYFNTLEKYLERIPDTETKLINELYGHMQDVQEALEHDVMLFQKASETDFEHLATIKDELKINTIKESLKA